MSEKPIFIKMKKKLKHQERLRDKSALFFKLSSLASLSALVLGLLCFFLLNIREIIPWVLFAFALLNGLNILLFRFHQNLDIAYHISSVLALLGTLTITLYSGGISSPFLFILALLVFTGYVSTRTYGRIYLGVSLAVALLLFILQKSSYGLPDSVIPGPSEEPFALMILLLVILMMGAGYGRYLLSTHHRLYHVKGEVEQRLQEKEMLLKEVHHRVKNNLQTVSSLLRMQGREIEDQNTRNLIRSSQNRVVSMAMVHEMLYMREDLSKIQYRSYVEELGEYLIKSIKGPESKIKLNIDIPQIELGIDTAIPLGLLINEAVTNALKYGFKDQDEGEISIVLEKEDAREYVLRIGDNGIGFPENIDHKTTKSLGLKLIHNLSRQLKGSVIRDLSKKGTYYIIRFQETNQNPLHTLS